MCNFIRPGEMRCAAHAAAAAALGAIAAGYADASLRSLRLAATTAGVDTGDETEHDQ